MKDVLFKSSLWLTTLILPVWSLCFAEDQKLDPASLILSAPIERDEVNNPKPADIESLKESEVIMNGVKYWKFSSNTGSIYVPRFDKFNKSDLEQALCTNSPEHKKPCKPGDKRCLDDSTQDKTQLLRAETRLSTELTLYASLIQSTIRKKCPTYAAPVNVPVPILTPDGSTVSPKVMPNLDVGVEMKDKTDGKKYRIYNKGLKPDNIGVGAEF